MRALVELGAAVNAQDEQGFKWPLNTMTQTLRKHSWSFQRVHTLNMMWVSRHFAWLRT